MFPPSRFLSHVSCLMSPVSCLLSHVSCLTSPVSRLLSRIFCLTYPVSRLTYHVSHLMIMSLVSCLLSHILSLTSHHVPVSCLMFLSHIFYLMSQNLFWNSAEMERINAISTPIHCHSTIFFYLGVVALKVAKCPALVIFLFNFFKIIFEGIREQQPQNAWAIIFVMD